jgi:hypothetical protein
MAEMLLLVDPTTLRSIFTGGNTLPWPGTMLPMGLHHRTEVENGENVAVHQERIVEALTSDNGPAVPSGLSSRE